MHLQQNFSPLDDALPVPLSFALIAVAALGAIIGSFLNVVIHRLPRDESIAFPNSRCPSCGVAIRPYDNIPVLSYVLLRGRCRACGTSIAARYPGVEVLTALLFVLTFYLRSGLTLALPFDLLFVAGLIALIFIDAEHMILPNAITYPGIALAFVARAIAPNLYGLGIFAEGAPAGYPTWLVSLLGAIIGALAGGGAEGHIRQYLIEDRNYLDAVIGLPANIFYGTSIPTCILVFKKCRENPEDVLFIDASQHYEKAKTQNYLTDADIEKIIDTFRERRAEVKYSRAATLAEVKENDYNLNIPRYVDTFEAEDGIDLDLIAGELKTLETAMNETDKTIADYCRQLNISTPF